MLAEDSQKAQPLPPAADSPSEIEQMSGDAAAEKAAAAEVGNSSTAAACARGIGLPGWSKALEEARELRIELARVRAERDAARRERDQLHRVCDDLKTQLIEERADAKAKRNGGAGVPADISREAVELMCRGLEVIASDLYLHEVVEKVVTITTQVLSCERVTLFLADPENRELSVLASADELEELRVPYSKGLVGSCAETKQPILVADAYSDKRFHKLVDTQTGYRTKAVLCSPVLDAKGELIAVLQAMNPLHGGAFTSMELQLLQFMQLPTSIALLNARLHKSLRSANESNSALVRVAMVVNEVDDSDAQIVDRKDSSITALINKVVVEACERFSATRATMYVCDHSKGEIWSLAAIGVDKRFSLPIGTGISGICAKSGEIINVRDAKKDPRASTKPMPDGFVMESTLCIPIVDNKKSGGERIIGVLQLLNKRENPHYFTDGDEAAIQAFSNIVALAMRNAMNIDDLRYRDAERQMIFSSISSHICRFAANGTLEKCYTPPEALEAVLGVTEERMRSKRFDEWLTKIQAPGQDSLTLSLEACLEKGAITKVRNAACEHNNAFVNFFVTPLVSQMLTNDTATGALLVLEDVSDQHKRKEAEEKLSRLEAEMSKMTETSALVSETPLQRAIDVVNQLMVTQSDLKEPLQDILTQLTSSNVMLPSMLTDAKKNSSLDTFTRDFLAGQTGVELPAGPGGGRTRLSRAVDDSSAVSRKDHSRSLDENRKATGAGSRLRPARRNSMPAGGYMAGKSASLPPGYHAPAPTGPLTGLPVVPPPKELTQSAVKEESKSRSPAMSPSPAPLPPPPSSQQPSTSVSPSLVAPHVRRMSSEDITTALLNSGSGTHEMQRHRRASFASTVEDEEEVEAMLRSMGPNDWVPPSHVSAELYTWGLDLYDCEGNPEREAHLGATPQELMASAHALLESMNIRGALGVSAETVQSFIIACHQGYHPKPFHNFVHATYVLHGCVLTLQQSPTLMSLLGPVERVALCIAALGHDIGHLGVQNPFLMNIDDPLALMYNDQSILENMHTSRLFGVLRQKGCTLLDGLTREGYRQVRKMIIEMIRGTDLAGHFEEGRLWTQFKNRLNTLADKPFSSETTADVTMAAGMVLHAADLSGPARPWKVSFAWSSKVQEEFVTQVEMEKQMGAHLLLHAYYRTRLLHAYYRTRLLSLPSHHRSHFSLCSSPLLSTGVPESKHLTAEKAQLETGFITLFVAPVWVELHKLLPEVDERVACLAENRSRWEAMMPPKDPSRASSRRSSKEKE